jgi:hypothetical protein
MTDPFEGEYLTLEQMSEVLRLEPSTLASRISRGTDHPPYLELRRGVKVFPKRMFLDWVAKKTVFWEVKGASKSSS